MINFRIRVKDKDKVEVRIIVMIGRLILKMVGVELNSISSEILTTNKTNNHQVHDFNHQQKAIILRFHIQIMYQSRKIQFPLTMETKIPISDKGKIIDENDKMTIQKMENGKR